tara:strand:- start:401 stop:613 length:213 start_codon:yes stop_codon:yes gene_type:complete
MSKPDNPPAFPYSIHMKGGDKLSFPGMTLRDYFAGQVLMTLMKVGPRESAHFAYAYADAMLAERAKEPKP